MHSEAAPSNLHMPHRNVRSWPPSSLQACLQENIQEDKQYTLTQEVSVKILPLMCSREKCKISGTIQVIETINDWSRIENDTETGWIRTKILEKYLDKIKNHSIKSDFKICYYYSNSINLPMYVISTETVFL